MAGSGSASSTWAPLRIGLFRSLWIAALVSNMGTWMQTVGAQWLLVHDAHAAVLVSLVQTAGALPAVLFGMVGGVLADIFDRVKLLVTVLAGMTAVGAALTALTAAQRMPPALLLMFTFVLGTGAILVAPAYHSLVPDMVPRPLVPAASALGSISINLARAIGPAIAGLLIARIGVAAVFALNAATFLLYAIVVACHPQLSGAPESPERFIPGLRAGGRYVRNAPVVRRMLLRAALFLVPGSSLWALLPLIATSRLGLGSGGYGVLLGALGLGAIGGALILPQARASLSANALVAVASLTYAASLAAVVLSRNLALTVLVLLPAGIAWIAFLSNVSRTWTGAWCAGRSPSCLSALIAAPGWSWCGPPTPSLPPGSSSSCAPWPTCAGRGCGPGRPTGACTRTARTRSCSSNCSASRAGKST